MSENDLVFDDSLGALGILCLFRAGLGIVENSGKGGFGSGGTGNWRTVGSPSGMKL